jgi:hypothetical protein
MAEQQRVEAKLSSSPVITTFMPVPLVNGLR